MSNRFHSKFHRQNHHTYTSVTNPDAGHDPIASREQPFWGDFVLAGALSCVAPASAVAGYFNSNFTALCAIAGQRGQYIYSFGNLGLEVYSAQSTAISAVGPYIGANISSSIYGINVYGGQYGINTNSPFYGINSYGGTHGGNFYSPIRALSAYGGQFGLQVYSPFYGIDSYGGIYAGRFNSPIRALSAFGGNIGLDLYSPVSGIYAFGGSAGGIFSSPIRALSANGGIVGFEVYSPISAINAFGGIVGARVYSPRRALSAYGGNIGFDVYSPQIAINAIGLNTGINVYSQNTAISSVSESTGMNLYGGSLGAVISSPVVALSTGGIGINRFDNRVGIFRTPQENYPKSPNIVFDVNGNSYFDGNITITGDLSALGNLTYLDTIVNTSSSLQVINVGSLSAAATFIQYGNNPILVCYDGDVSTTVSSFMVDSSTRGWVSLGTNTPTAPFNIVKNNTANQANNQPQVRISDDNVTTRLAIGTPRTGRTNSSIGMESNHSFDIITNNTTYLTVSSSGRVGINTALPDNAALDVNGAIKLRAENFINFGISTQDETSLSAVYAYLPAVGTAGSSDWAFLRQIGTSDSYHLALDLHDNPNSSSDGQSFSIRNIASTSNPDVVTTRFIIDGEGDVGINTSTPNVHLTVNGQISANNTITGSTIASNGNINATSGTITALSLVSNGSISSATNATIGGTLSATNIANARPLTLGTGTNTNVAYTVNNWETSLISNVPTGFTLTLTLPSPAANPGRWLYIKSLSIAGNGGAVVSAGNNVEPLGSTTAGTAILAAGGSRWAQLQSDGTDWIIMASN